ncbi:MAG: hypothetical protein ACM3OF_03695 [Gemmatimonas sp.]
MKLIYWRAIALAELGDLGELARLILRGDTFPNEYQQTIAEYLSGVRKPRKRRALRTALDLSDATAVRLLLKALTHGSRKHTVQDLRRFVRAVTGHPPRNDHGPTPTDSAKGAQSVDARSSPDAGSNFIAPMSRDEACACIAALFGCSKELVSEIGKKSTAAAALDFTEDELRALAAQAPPSSEDLRSADISEDERASAGKAGNRRVTTGDTKIPADFLRGYWAYAVKLADRGNFQELEQLILAGDSVPVEYRQVLADFVTGARKLTRRVRRPSLSAARAMQLREAFAAITTDDPEIGFRGLSSEKAYGAIAKAAGLPTETVREVVEHLESSARL